MLERKSLDFIFYKWESVQLPVLRCACHLLLSEAIIVSASGFVSCGAELNMRQAPVPVVGVPGPVFFQLCR